MATYEDIYGKRVKEFDSDPTLESSYEGQVWYDKSSGTLKTVTASIEAWSSSSPQNREVELWLRQRHHAGFLRPAMIRIV